MSLGSRLDRALNAMLLQQEGAVASFDPKPGRAKGGHGAQPRPITAPSGNSRPLAQVWAERVDRLIERIEVDASLRRAPEATPRNAKKAELRQRIHEYEGLVPEEVAFWERCSLDTVVRVRKDLGLNVRTGERVKRDQRVLTAHPQETLRHLQDTIGGEL